MSNLLNKLTELEAVLKHQPGQHDQLTHSPHKGSSNLGERAKALMDDLNVRLGGVLRDVGGETERGLIGSAFDMQHENAVKKQLENMGFKQSESFGKTTVYSYGVYQGKGYSGSEVDAAVVEDKYGKGYLDITDNVAQDLYNVAHSPGYGKVSRGRRRYRR